MKLLLEALVGMWVFVLLVFFLVVSVSRYAPHAGENGQDDQGPPEF